jgi:hypothetical protein
MRRRGIDRVAGFLELAMSERGLCELIADGHRFADADEMLYRAKISPAFASSPMPLPAPV